MAGLLDFVAKFSTEDVCIEHLATLRWPGGYLCPKCGGRHAWRLAARPRMYECSQCHHQESVTAGTIFHRTRTALPKWFLAAYLMGNDNRGVSAKFLQRELGLAYETAWTMAHKLRHGLSEDPACPLSGFLEADETFIGGRGDPRAPAGARQTQTKAWSSLPSRRSWRRRTRRASMATPSSVSMASTRETSVSLCSRPPMPWNLAPSSRPTSPPSHIC